MEAQEEQETLSLASLISAAPTHRHLQSQIEALPHLGPGALRCLLIGAPRSGKTSMLFHLSCDLAARGRRVVWLCSQAKLEQSPPAAPPPPTPTSSAACLDNVRFKYVSDLSGVRRYAAALHLLPPDRLPHAVVVEDVSALAAATTTGAGAGAGALRGASTAGGDAYGGGGGDGRGGGGGAPLTAQQREVELTKALALLSDALEAASDAAAAALGPAGGPRRRLFVSDSAGDDIGGGGGGAGAAGGAGAGAGGGASAAATRPNYLLARWFDARLTVTGVAPGGLTLQAAAGAPQHVPAGLARARLHFSVLPSTGPGADAISFSASGVT